ncbi:MAG: hypothetical protein LBN31_13940 [Hungatella sp.]|jgi:hypothetical protein|nr:hypothetical protein [Hungatella sp.]
MKLIGKNDGKGKIKVPEIPVMVLPEKRHGTVIGTGNNLVGVLLNTGEYIDVPGNRVRQIFRP